LNSSDTQTRQRRAASILLAVVIVLASIWVLTFPRSPEDWSYQVRLREHGLFGVLLPFGDYPYYRPLWHAYLKLCDMFGLSGGLAHVGVLAAHVGALLIVFRLLCSFGCPIELGVTAVAFAGIAPGTSGALSWLPAGNKAFTLLFLAIGAWILRRRRDWTGVLMLIGFSLIPGLGSSENFYLAILMFPMLVIVLPRDVISGPRVRSAFIVFVISLALGLLHHSFLPQSSDPAASRLHQLTAQIGSGPFVWLAGVTENMGRFFAHGIGLADDWPTVGVVLLGMAFLWSLWLLSEDSRERSGMTVLAAVVVFVLLNVPASLFLGESHRHHAYLPAIGAGFVIGAVVNSISSIRSRRLIVAVIGVWFIVMGIADKQPWSRYLHQADRVLASTYEVMPERPSSQSVVLLNVPWEYLAAFTLRFGRDVDARKWHNLYLVGNSKYMVFPKGIPLPKTSASSFIEFDGRKLRKTTLAELSQRKPAPDAWYATGIRPFPDPFLAWSSILTSQGPIEALNYGFEPTGTDAAPVSGQRLRVKSSGLVTDGRPSYSWNVEGSVEQERWLVLPWAPLPFVTERAVLDTLAKLPWAFRVEVRNAHSHAPVDVEVRPVLGFFPAIRVPAGAFDWVVRLRGR